ncbi:MAG: hypothetical protein KAH23_03680 [Kiritimatiellae bacterium]|nr:hypothetical protein [Kiritimatiellia bacterium]
MKKILPIFLIMGTLSSYTYAESKQQLLVVKSSDIAKAQKYSIISPAELKTLLKEIKAETKVHNKALMLAVKEWGENEDLAKRPFPRSALAIRKVVVTAKYTDKEKAQKKLDSYIKKPKAKKTSKKHGRRNKTKTKKKSKSELTKKARAVEKEHLAEQAREIYKRKQAVLLGIQPEEADPNEGIDQGVDPGVDPGVAKQH